MIRVCLSITLSVSMYSCQLALSVSLKFTVYLSQVYFYFYFCQLPQPAICHHLLQRLCFVCCVCQHCLCLLSVTKKCTCHNSYLSQNAICHNQLPLTVNYLSQSAICHCQLSVTVCYLSQSPICHYLQSVTVSYLSQSAVSRYDYDTL